MSESQPDVNAGRSIAYAMATLRHGLACVCSAELRTYDTWIGELRLSFLRQADIAEQSVVYPLLC